MVRKPRESARYYRRVKLIIKSLSCNPHPNAKIVNPNDAVDGEESFHNLLVVEIFRGCLHQNLKRWQEGENRFVFGFHIIDGTRKGSEIRKCCIKLIGKLWRNGGRAGGKITPRIGRGAQIEFHTPSTQNKPPSTLCALEIHVEHSPTDCFFPTIPAAALLCVLCLRGRRENEEEIGLEKSLAIPPLKVLNLIFHVYRLAKLFSLHPNGYIFAQPFSYRKKKLKNIGEGKKMIISLEFPTN